MTDEWRVRYLGQSRHDWYEAARRFMTHSGHRLSHFVATHNTHLFST
jgi:hypothetical protein